MAVTHVFINILILQFYFINCQQQRRTDDRPPQISLRGSGPSISRGEPSLPSVLERFPNYQNPEPNRGGKPQAARSPRCEGPPKRDSIALECQAHITTYTYNKNTNLCEKYIYGGCGKGINLFESLQECVDVCKASNIIEDEPEDVQQETYCSLPTLAIPLCPNNNGLPRYFYNPIQNSCILLKLCPQSSDMGFLTSNDCENSCVAVDEDGPCEPVSPDKSRCPAETTRLQYYYNPETHACEGVRLCNGHGFDSQLQCVNVCILANENYPQLGTTEGYSLPTRRTSTTYAPSSTTRVPIKSTTHAEESVDYENEKYDICQYSSKYSRQKCRITSFKITKAFYNSGIRGCQVHQVCPETPGGFPKLEDCVDRCSNNNQEKTPSRPGNTGYSLSVPQNDGQKENGCYNPTNYGLNNCQRSPGWKLFYNDSISDCTWINVCSEITAGFNDLNECRKNCAKRIVGGPNTEVKLPTSNPALVPNKNPVQPIPNQKPFTTEIPVADSNPVDQKQFLCTYKAPYQSNCRRDERQFLKFFHRKSTGKCQGAYVCESVEAGFLNKQECESVCLPPQNTGDVTNESCLAYKSYKQCGPLNKNPKYFYYPPAGVCRQFYVCYNILAGYWNETECNQKCGAKVGAVPINKCGPYQELFSENCPFDARTERFLRSPKGRNCYKYRNICNNFDVGFPTKNECQRNCIKF